MKAAAAFTRLPEVKAVVEDASNREDADDIINNICRYFAFDINYFGRDFSIVLMIDTIETLDHKWKQYTVKNLLTHYLPRHIRNILWVFAGRDKIYDANSTIVKELNIEEHLLGNLSKEDSYLYLKEKQKINDESIVALIYEISGGTPVLLDLCVKTYRDEGENEPDVFSRIDKKEIVERYVKYLSDREQDVIRAMASVQHWTDDDFKDVFMAVFGLNVFTSYLPAYTALIESTMIEKISDERFFLHRSVRNTIYDDPKYPQETRIKTRAAIIQMYKRRIERDSVDVVYYKERVIDLLDTLIQRKEKLSIDEANDFIVLMDQLIKKIRNYGYSEVEEITEVLLSYVKNVSMNIFILNGFLVMLAKMYSSFDDNVNSMKMNELILQYLTETGDGECDMAILVMSNLLHDYNELGMEKEAKKLSEKALHIVNSSEINDQVAIPLLCSIAWFYIKSGKTDLGITMYEDVLSKLKGTDNKEMQAEVLINLGSAYSLLGDFKRADAYFSKGIEMLYDPSLKRNPELLKLTYNLAIHLENSGNTEKSIKCREQLLEISDFTFGADSRFVINLIEKLIDSYLDLGKEDKVLPLFEKLIDKYRIKYGEDSEKTLSLKEQYAHHLMHLNRLEEAKPFIEETLEKSKTVLGETHETTISLIYDKGVLKAAAEEYRESLAILDKALRLAKENLGEENKLSLNIMNYIGIVYYNLEQNSEAIHYLEQALQIIYKSAGTQDEYSQAIIANLIQIYEEDGKEKNKKKIDSLRRFLEKTDDFDAL